ncbi:MAG: molybdate ABC transporter substrate-binding protein [Gammaproteobacteria bacterium]|jgi:molybdate transport system substrate-binding protein
MAGLVLIAGVPAALADEAMIAAASNFRAALEALAPEFEAATGHRLVITTGSTGQLYAQITNGAPFDAFLAADQERPRLLAERGLGDPESVFTYAIGRLALWSRDPERVGEDSLEGLRDSDFRWFALAEPAVAPYGAAARQALESMGVWESIQARLVRGQNVAQAFAMIETGNAELGLVSLAQVLDYPGSASYVVVPARLHEPIRQDAVLLVPGADNAAAQNFLEWLRGPAPAAILDRFGYGSPLSVR